MAVDDNQQARVRVTLGGCLVDGGFAGLLAFNSEEGNLESSD